MVSLAQLRPRRSKRRKKLMFLVRKCPSRTALRAAHRWGRLCDVTPEFLDTVVAEKFEAMASLGILNNKQWSAFQRKNALEPMALDGIRPDLGPTRRVRFRV